MFCSIFNVFLFLCSRDKCLLRFCQLLKNNGTPGGQKLDFKKKGNKRNGPGESTYTGSAGAKGRAHAAGTSPGKSRRNFEKVLAENLQVCDSNSFILEGLRSYVIL